MKFLFVPSFFVLFSITLAQNKGPCESDNHKAFDFWIGSWEVSDSLGTVLGKNSITKIHSNCALQEKWTGATGFTGTSLNYFDKTNNTWNQLWVDQTGVNLKLKGGLSEGSMVLKGDLIEGKNGKYYNQVTWKHEKDSSVIQIWEIFSELNELVQTVFWGRYTQKQSRIEAVIGGTKSGQNNCKPNC